MGGFLLSRGDGEIELRGRGYKPGSCAGHIRATGGAEPIFLIFWTVFFLKNFAFGLK